MGAIPTLTGTGYLFPLQTGNSGKFLTTDGSVLSWGTPSGGGGVTGSGTTNYLSKWTSGTITPDYYIKVEIDGQIYSIPALLGTP